MHRRLTRRLGGGLIALAAGCGSPLAAQFGASGAPANGRPAQPPVVTAGPPTISFEGSVAPGEANATPLDLSLRDAVQRGLRFNLGLLTSAQSALNVRAQRLRVLSELLPNVSADYTQNYSRVNLAAEGFRVSLPANSPFQIPQIVTFGSVDTRVSVSQPLFDLARLRNLRSADASVRAAQLSIEDSRDLVVQAVGNAYLLIISDAARVDAAKGRIDTSQTLFQRAVDQRAAGTVPAIDQLRAEVQLRTDQQSLLVAQNQFEKDKIALARVIGLPAGQSFRLTDTLPFAPLSALTVDQALKQAYANRPDYKSASERVRAAELARKGAVAEYYPTASVSGNFGDAGVNIGHSHDVFGVTGALQWNIFSGGRVKSDIEQADVSLRQQRDALGDLKGQIDQEVRTSLLDLQSAADQVAVARRNVDLAHETLTQSRDRFAAGVTDNVEVVQAQQSVVTADANLHRRETTGITWRRLSWRGVRPGRTESEPIPSGHEVAYGDGGRKTPKQKAPEAQDAHESWTPKHNKWLIAITVTMATFMEVLDTSIANVALPHIAGNLSAGQDESTWVLTSYLVSNAVILPISGWLGTIFGRKRFYMTCVALFGDQLVLVRAGADRSAGWSFSGCCRGSAAADWRRASRPFWRTRFRRENAGMAFALYGMAVVLRLPSGPRWAGTSPITTAGGGSSSSIFRWP